MDDFLKISGLIAWSLAIIVLILNTFFSKRKVLNYAASFFIGLSLKKSISKLVNEFPDEVKKDTIANVAYHLIVRLTRIGMIGLIVAGIPIFLLYRQNTLIASQNKKIDSQIRLEESSRRSSLVLLMSNIFDQLNAEINSQKVENQFIQDSTSASFYQLSDPLIGRIVALSQGFLPYNILEGEGFTFPISPERGQLLLTLVNSNLDKETMDQIFQTTTFSYAYLKGVSLKEKNLSYANLRKADFRSTNLIGTNLSYTWLPDANLQDAWMEKVICRGAMMSGAKFSGNAFNDADMSHVIIINTDLSGSALRRVKMNNANLASSIFRECNFWNADLSHTLAREADMTGADLRNTNFRNAILVNTIFRNANMKGAILEGANLSGADFSGAHGMTFDQLNSAECLYNCKGISSTIMQQLKKKNPEIFNHDNCTIRFFNEVQDSLSYSWKFDRHLKRD